MTKLSAFKGLHILMVIAMLAAALPFGAAFMGASTAEAAAAPLWTGLKNLSHTPGKWTGMPRNSTDANGYTFAAFEDRAAGDPGQILGNDNVSGWRTPASQITDYNAGGGSRDASIATKGTRTVAGWQRYNDGHAKSNVYVKVRTSAGNWPAPTSGWVQVSHATGSGKASSIALTSGPNGFYAVWMQSNSGNDSDYQVYFSQSSDGSSWSTPQLLPAAKGSKWPKIAVNTDNNIVVAWMQGGQIWATQRVSGSWDTPQNISTAGYVAHDVNLAADANGNIHAVWDAAWRSGYDLDVIYREWSGATNKWLTKNQITNYDPYKDIMARNAAVGVSPSGEVVIAWSDDNGRLSSDFQIIYARGTVDGSGVFHSTTVGPILPYFDKLDKNPWLSSGASEMNMTFRSQREDSSIDVMYAKLNLIPPLQSAVTSPSGWKKTTSFTVTWDGTAPHGVEAYGIQVGTKSGSNINWSDWLSPTTEISGTFNAVDFDGGASGTTYYFRSLVKDTGGAWETKGPNVFDKKVTLDTDKPSGDFQINSGAEATASNTVKLTFSYSDTVSGVGTISVSNDGSKWKNIVVPVGKTIGSTSWNLKDPTFGGTSTNNESKTVYVKYTDRANNVSDAVSHSIFLDKLPPTGQVSINDGAPSTTILTVTLTLTATDSSGLPVKRYRLGNVVNGIVSWKTAWTDFPDSTGTATISDYKLAGGAYGNRKVVARFEDAAGNRSIQYFDTITYAKK
ncbi:MAG: hypothetical protein M1319_01995 [Chloroflexi bacterium]|nr:hypothetical protein [Chloroflexota bacterium]